MSNVQSPKSHTRDPQARNAGTQAGAADVGRGTLDFGLTADIGRWTLDLRLTVTDLRKSFASPSGERIEVLRGVSFAAAPGEVVAIMGSSGAGKSTLLHLLGGLEAADHGSINAGQFAIDRATPSTLARFRNTRVGFVFQFHNLLTDLTAAENVSLPLRITRTSRREAMRQALEMLEKVRLDSRVS
ncbi:MAG: ATP-binding cassette domain-containing protein, partial [Acidobacteria bacterium]|nr:ATP-binding cassette domain-containing protein [Acidobacteriota bacterium]